MPLALRRPTTPVRVRTWLTTCAVATFAVSSVLAPAASSAVVPRAAASATQQADASAPVTRVNPRVSVTGPSTSTTPRSTVEVERVARSSSRAARKTKLSLRFPDGAHRTRASLVHPRTGVVYVVTAGRERAGIYRTARRATAGKHALKKVSTAPRHIAAGTFSTDGGLAALATDKRAYVYRSFRSTPAVVSLPSGSRASTIRFNEASTHLVVDVTGGGETTVALPAVPSTTPGTTTRGTGTPATPKTPAPPTSPGGPGTPGTPAPVSSWAPSFTEEFDSINPARWNVRNRTYNSNEDSYLMAANTSISSGQLKIRAALESMGGRSYTSGYLDSNGKVALPNYFRAEIRAKVPMQHGMWAAPLWLRPSDFSGGEIDLLETYGCDRAKPLVHQTIHTDYGAGHRQNHQTTPFAKYGDTTGTEWHTYTIEKTPGSIVMYTDGIQSASFSPANTPWFNQYYEAGKSWNMRINLQVGGADDNRPNATTDWSGENTTMRVDYVRTWTPAT